MTLINSDRKMARGHRIGNCKRNKLIKDLSLVFYELSPLLAMLSFKVRFCFFERGSCRLVATVGQI